jgi:hypothetical protein
MKTFRLLVSALVATSVSASAFAATISGVVTPLGANKFEINVYLNTDGPPAIVSFDLRFRGEGGLTVLNTLGFGQSQPLGSVANIPDQFDPNYSKTTDSWFDDELQPNGSQLGFVAITPVEGTNLLQGGMATDVTASPPQSFTSGRIAHLYVQSNGGGSLRALGSVAVGSAPVQAINVFLPGFFPSEPTSGTMTALALVAFTAFRRKRPA